MSNHWLPASRVGQLALAKQWQAVIAAKATAWNIPAAEAAAFSALITAAELATLNLSKRGKCASMRYQFRKAKLCWEWRNILVALAGSGAVPVCEARTPSHLPPSEFF